MTLRAGHLSDVSPPVGNWFSSGGGFKGTFKFNERNAVSHCPTHCSTVFWDDSHLSAGWDQDWIG
jgi:hypothetical protein